jgi:uncharacterized protein (TIGR02246 family)
VTEFSELPAADQEAIGKTLLTLLNAFDDRDAEPLQAVYSDDADWVNAFGTVKRGRDDIVDYLRGLFGTTTSIAASWQGRRRRVFGC